MDRVSQLAELISELARKYYEDGESGYSDAEFDELVDELRELDPNNEVLSTTGWGYKSESNKVKHYSYLSGIRKVKVTPDDVIISTKSLNNATEVYTPKLDGASVELQYENRKLVKAVTRGDGEVGFDCTDKLRDIVPNEITINYDKVSIIGEYVISKENAKKISDSNSIRNIANGYLNRNTSDTDTNKLFNFVAYRIGYRKINYNCISNTYLDRVDILDILKNNGFEVPKYITNDSSWINLSYRVAYDTLTEGTDYLYDGIVCDSMLLHMNNINLDTNIEYSSVAYKVITEVADTTVNNISWNLTRTGKFIPTLELDPVELSGATISRVLAHNADYINTNKINVGSVVTITRSGEVIPYILKVSKKVEPELPSVCPICKSRLKWDGVNLICDNTICEGKSYYDIKSWVYNIGDTKSIGSKLFNKFIDFFEIRNLNDLYDIEVDDLDNIKQCSGVDISAINNLKRLVESLHRTITTQELLKASNISKVGYRTSVELSKSIDFVEFLSNNEELSFSSMLELRDKGNWSKAIQSICDNYPKLVRNFKLTEVINPIEEVKDDSDKLKVCITGKLNYGTKSKFYEYYSNYITEATVANCDVLVCNEDKGSSKSAKAAKLGKEVITEDELVRRILCE